MTCSTSTSYEGVPEHLLKTVFSKRSYKHPTKTLRTIFDTQLRRMNLWLTVTGLYILYSYPTGSRND